MVPSLTFPQNKTPGEEMKTWLDQKIYDLNSSGRCWLVSFKVIFPTKKLGNFLWLAEMFGENLGCWEAVPNFWGRDFIISFWIWPCCSCIYETSGMFLTTRVAFDVDLKTHEETAIFWDIARWKTRKKQIHHLMRGSICSSKNRFSKRTYL